MKTLCIGSSPLIQLRTGYVFSKVMARSSLDSGSIIFRMVILNGYSFLGDDCTVICFFVGDSVAFISSI